MTTPTRTSRFTLRLAEEDEYERLMAFYRANAKEASPPPDLGSLTDALRAGLLMVIEDEASGDLVAASATFDFSPAGFRSYVGELSGTCVTGPLNGCRPLSVQRMLLAIRVAITAYSTAEPVAGSTNTLISIVKDDNLQSRRNIEAARLAPIPTLPSWMAYVHHSWTGDGGAGWTYYMATAETVAQAISDLDVLGFFSGPVRLLRDDRVNGGEEAIEIRCAMNGMRTVEAVMREIQAGEQEVHLSPPPARLIR